MDKIPVKNVIPIDQLFGEDEEDTRLLRGMVDVAQEFLLSFSWCKSIREMYFGSGVGGVVAVFFFHIEPSRPDVDEWLWVVVGDVPPAFLVIDLNKSPSQVLESYIDEMAEWVKLAEHGCSSEEVIPVNVPATREHAKALAGRLKVLRDVIVPMFQSGEAMQS